MTQERIWRLISRKMAGEATVQELEELDALLHHHPEWKDFAAHLCAAEATTGNEDEAESAYAAHIVKMKLGGHLDEPEAAGAAPDPVPAMPRRYKLRTVWGVAAGVILLAGAYLFHLSNKSEQALAKTNEIVTKKGSSSKVKLPDGTEVWLNSDSKLTYGQDFMSDVREVTLCGEAYFDVAKDSTKPFIIHTDKIDITVLGTAFNVRNYPQDETVEAALIHGKIEITFTDSPSEKIILNPNEKISVRKDPKPKVEAGAMPVAKVKVSNISLLKDNKVQETAWMQNELVFVDESFEEIARMLERRFDVTFQFRDEAVQDFRYTGLFKHEGLEKILDVMSLSQEFSYSIQERKVIIGK